MVCTCASTGRIYIAYCLIAIIALSNDLKFASAENNFFCGKSWADASSNCDRRQSCPGATDDECSAHTGHVCFSDTLCSGINDVSVSTNADSSFCGLSWADASSNCDDRQPCPHSMDDECSVPGHVCYGDTSCSVEAGHGGKFKYQKLIALVDVDYDETSNTQFCGIWWGGSEENCSIETHCPHGECFDPEQMCHGTKCNIIDIAEQELGANWKQLVGGGGGGGGPIVQLDPDDPKRNYFCGINWVGASAECADWCGGSEDDCRSGQKCFADTTCYYDVGAVPSMSPIISPGPTGSPILSNDPVNTQFCGNMWGLAIQNCSPKTHCVSDADCGRNEKCYPDLPGCNLYDMTTVKEPQSPPPTVDYSLIQAYPWMADPNLPANYRFCGGSWDDAANNCNLDRHCPDYKCPSGLQCFENLNLIGAGHCNAYKINTGDTRMPTQRPTQKPTQKPTQRPTQRPTQNPTQKPTQRPTMLPTTKKPTESPTPNPSKAPAASPQTANPTREPTAEPTAEPTIRPTARPTARPPKYPTHHPTTISTNAPVQVIEGLCAESFKHLQQTYLTAQECSNINPCKFGQFCFPARSTSSTTVESGTYSPTDKVPTYSPTYRHATYSPTIPFQQANAGKNPVAGENPIPQPNNTQKPVYSMQWMQPTTPKHATPDPTTTKPATMTPTTLTPTTPKPTNKATPMTTAQITGTPISDEKRFYCAKSLEELKQTCGSALACDASMRCPTGQGCILYNDCNQTQQKHDSATGEENKSTLWNYLPNLCPLGFVGMHSLAGDCQYYYDCRDGFLEASQTCELGFLFDNSRGECISQRFVNSKCSSEDMKIPDICPDGLVGLHSPPARNNCRKYYDCQDGLLLATFTCEGGFQFDNVRGECISENLVGSDCNGVVLEVNNEHHQITYESGEALPESYLPSHCPAGLSGLHAQGDCTKYYECNDTLVLAVHTCELGFKFDIILGECVSQYLVDRNCVSVSLETNDGKKQAAESEVKNDDSQPGYISDAQNGRGYGTDSLGDSVSAVNEVEGNGNNLQSDSALKTDNGNQMPDEPLGNFQPDFCPLGLNGFHAKGDCSKYYECTDGYIGFIRTCTMNFKFDNIRGRCISGDLVSEYCNGPSLDEAERDQPNELRSNEGESTNSSNSTPASSPPSGSPSIAENRTTLWSHTAAPTALEDEPHWASWIKDYYTNNGAPKQSYFCIWVLSLVPILSLF